jgi:hypothetical protein
MIATTTTLIAMAGGEAWLLIATAVTAGILFADTIKGIFR